MKMMKGKAGEVKVKMKKMKKVRVGQGDVTTLSIDRRQHGTSMTGMHCSSIAGSTGHPSWASTIPCSRDARTAILLNANWLPRDARTVVSLNANRPEIVEAQLPLLMTMKPSFEEVAGSLPPCSHVSVGPYTSCSISTVSHESFDRVAPGPWCRDPHTSRLSYAARELDEPRWPLVSPVPSHRNDPGARPYDPTPVPPPEGGGILPSRVHRFHPFASTSRESSGSSFHAEIPGHRPSPGSPRRP